jgi:hypothetical protein
VTGLALAVGWGALWHALRMPFSHQEHEGPSEEVSEQIAEPEVRLLSECVHACVHRMIFGDGAKDIGCFAKRQGSMVEPRGAAAKVQYSFQPLRRVMSSADAVLNEVSCPVGGLLPVQLQCIHILAAG